MYIIHQERRNHIRVSLNDSERLSGTLYGTDKMSFFAPCIISELSMAGLKLSIDNDATFTNGQTLVLRGLQTASGYIIGEKILLKVECSVKQSSRGLTVYGCRFITISRKTQENIAVIMRQKISGQPCKSVAPINEPL